MCMCVCIYIYIYIFIFIHTENLLNSLESDNAAVQRTAGGPDVGGMANVLRGSAPPLPPPADHPRPVIPRSLGGREGEGERE